MHKTLHYLCLTLFAISFLTLSGCSPKESDKLIKNTVQKSEHYVNQPASRRLISQASQHQHEKEYLQQYFGPWNNNTGPSKASVNIFFNKEFLQFSTKPGFGENQHQIPPMLIHELRENANMKAFSKPYQNAITLQLSNIRRLPTSIPSFSSINDPGNAFPFDRFQNSLINANTPVRILHHSKDREWSLIECGYLIGWVKSSQLATVDSSFIHQWQNNHYLTPLNDHAMLTDRNHQHLAQARIGSIYPLLREDHNRYQILVADRDQNHRALIKKVWVSKKDFSTWPMVPTVAQFTQQINEMLGEPYGWGGLFGYRDCSSTTMDLFASFGIWLPRGAHAQASAGQYTKLDNLNNEQKIERINKQAKDMLTLIDLPGHVMLYIGTQNKTPYVFHNVWGLPTRKLSTKPGRLVIGQAVITPINLGEQYWNIQHSFLDQTIGMTTIK